MNVYKPKNKTSWHFAIVLGRARKQSVIHTYVTDRRVAEEIMRKTRQLADIVEAGMPLPIELRRWLEAMNSKLRKRLTNLGLVGEVDAASMNGIEQHVEDYINACRFEGQCDQHLKIKHSQLNRTIKHTGARRLSDLTYQNISTFLQSLKTIGRSHRTINQHRATVVAWLNWCVMQQRIDHHTLDHIPRLNEDMDRRRSRRVATDEEADRFLAAAPPRRRFVYLAALYTGLRRGEMNKIERRDINLAEATLTIRPEVGKTRKPVVIPLHENLVKLLTERLVNLKSNALVFKPVPNMKTFKRDLAAAGIAFKDENDHQFDFHALRTTFSTRLLREGIPLSIARRLTRHDSVATLEKHYDKLGLSDAVEALKKMPGYGKRA